tara:strand:- start:1124 stop:1468 length:345 start_codon:yes stop_codon:yes gene_type:complete
MPIYVFQHPETEEYKEILQGMNEEHTYTDKEGIEWTRIFFSPNMAMDLEADPFDRTKFLEKTSNAGTMGEMWDRSAELSEKRAEKSGGADPYKKKYFKKYSKERGGEKHPLDNH